MKVTRLKKGYNIRLSDAEMNMLNWLVLDGIASGEGLEEYEFRTTWSASEKAAWTRRLAKVGSDYAVLKVDEDRRS
jgi:hypothetical protein